MTLVEELLIARAFPMVRAFCKFGNYGVEDLEDIA